MLRNFLSKLGHWLLQRIRLIPDKDRKNTKWFMLSFYITSLFVAIIYAIGNPTGVSLFAHVTNIGKLVLLHGITYCIWTLIISAILSFLYIPFPRLLLSSFSYLMFASVIVFIIEDSGVVFAFTFGISYSLLCLLFTLLLLLLFKKRFIMNLVIFSLLIVSSYLVFEHFGNALFTRDVPAMADMNLEQLNVENPGEEGNYSYTFLTYGSGTDKHRSEFGQNVNIITPTVDASHFITRWKDKREEFWGFNQSQLPINGRVWLPDGEGPFPVILIVHGNHTMEDFSTSGYDYLGEQLASRGFITISVDEDFINYSNVSGIPNNNYELRTWILLKHLVQLKDLNETIGNPLYEKVDLTNVGLVGHSRGGQAVAMAADYKRFFDDEPWFNQLQDIQIKGIVALAPTDKSLDGKRAWLSNVSYFVIQGAQDADINTFQGDRQYYRTSVSNDTFKASLYIAGANHSQFNTEWGSMDTSLPEGLILNQMQTIEPEEQRQLAKVNISAFFERTLHGQMIYEEFFRNYQHGISWLPDTIIVTKYENSTYFPLIEFDNNKPVMAKGISTNEDGFSEVNIFTPKDRRNNNRTVDASHLKWKSTAEYTIKLEEFDKNRLENKENLMLTMANFTGEDNRIPEIQILLETTDGIKVDLPLSAFLPFPPVITSDFTHFGWFDSIFREGKYENSWEAVFQSFEIPLDAFEKKNAKFDRNKLKRISLQFDRPSGEVLLEGIGLSR
ncbi:alpha/beta hydrolase family protein [Ornithinibacillus halotolerans]|uniref:Alpha/beta hydrolase n=1 Tax=Ornithinibacillus halotolerans TaxID=1274357 RepID=A0A916RV58_9BACI|nr:hypothetical protein [Ornithinibacillus halotolerans]GGA71264.1 hypothetical protein GCM10008025_13930 [Ornithinibacillus halotolerans]